MEEALRAALASVAGGRVYWGRAEQGAAFPYVVLNRITGIRDYHTRGPSGYVQSRVQVDCYAETYLAAKGAARSVSAIMNGYSGGDIQGVFIDSERDLPAENAGPADYLFRVSLDLMIHHVEN